MVVASPSQISLALYPEERRVYPVYSIHPVYAACPVYAESRSEPRREPRSERTRKALRARSLPRPDQGVRRLSRPGRGVKTHLQPRPRPADRVHPEWLPAFSSPNLSPFNFKLLALRVVEGSTFNRPSLRPLPAVDCMLSAVSSRPSFPNSHRITSFADPHRLTPIESYSCKKQGEGGPPYPQSAARGLISLRNTQESPQPQSLHAFTP